MIETKDIKMDLFIQKETWERGIEHGVNKRINTPLLQAVMTPYGRALIVEAIEDGRYKIKPPTITEVPKANGKIREVFCNEQMDRLVLNMINDVYYQLYSSRIHPSCVAYQKGLGVSKIIRQVVGKLESGYSGYKVDLTKYFDTVNKETLFNTLEELSTDSPLDKVVKDYYYDDTVMVNGKLVERYKSLAQGCSLGTLLANLVLADIDAKMSEFKIVYFRYSDDLLLIGEDADVALEVLEHELSKKGLSLNPSKIEKINKDSEFTFLGCKVQGQEVDISDDSIKRYKDKIREITKMRKGMKVGSRRVQRKAIKEINYYLYEAFLKSSQNFGWMCYFGSICTTNKSMIMLDEFTKDRIKSMYTGKFNHTTNMHKTSNEQLKELGYKSLNHMYTLYKIDKDVFNAEIRKV